jgi:hypothetical protein
MSDRFSEIRSNIINIINEITGLNLKKVYIRQNIDNKLYLLDIDQRLYDTRYSFIRGSILDIRKKEFFLKCEEFPRTKIVYTPLINKKKNTRFYRGYDGCILRVFEYNGKIYYSTNRSFDARNNKIYSFKESRTFNEILESMGKRNSIDEIFGMKRFKDMIHLFLIISKETYLIMQGDIEEKIIYLGSKIKYSDNSHFIIEDVAEKFERLGDLSIQEANSVLGFGDNNIEDKRLDIFNTGFIVKENITTGKKTFLYSESYAWRRKLIGLKNSNNILNVFIEMRKYLNDLNSYKNTFPYIVDIEKLETKEYPREIDRKELENNLVRCLYLIMPKHKKQEALGIKQVYENFINELSERLCNVDDSIMNKIFGRVLDFVEEIKNIGENNKSKIIEKLNACYDSEIMYVLGRTFGLI